MMAKHIETFLESFKWSTICNMYVSAHNSIIGFISSEWINQSQYNSVLDGAPSPRRGDKRCRKKYADILLLKHKKPYVVVEVESYYGNYRGKIESIEKYFKNKTEFNGLDFGLLIMTNIYDFPKGKKCWDYVENKIKTIKDPIAFVSIEKKTVKSDKTPLDHFREINNNFKMKDIEEINYRIYTPNGFRKGPLYP